MEISTIYSVKLQDINKFTNLRFFVPVFSAGQTKQHVRWNSKQTGKFASNDHQMHQMNQSSILYGMFTLAFQSNKDFHISTVQ